MVDKWWKICNVIRDRVQWLYIDFDIILGICFSIFIVFMAKGRFQLFQVISINFHQIFYQNWRRFGFKWISLFTEEIASERLLFQETELEQISWNYFDDMKEFVEQTFTGSSSRSHGFKHSRDNGSFRKIHVMFCI